MGRIKVFWSLSSKYGRRFNIKMSVYESHCGDKTYRRLISTMGFSILVKHLNLRALKLSPVNRIYIFQCMSKIFCVEFPRYPLKFCTKYLTHTLKYMIFIQHWHFKSSYAFLNFDPQALWLRLLDWPGGIGLTCNPFKSSSVQSGRILCLSNKNHKRWFSIWAPTDGGGPFHL